MNKFQAIRLLSFLFVLCNSVSCSNQKQEHLLTDGSQLELLHERRAVMSIIHGGWVLQENTNKLDSLLPLSKAFPYGQAYSELIIDTSEIDGDTIPNYGCLANGKEGHHFKLVFEKGAKPLRMLFHHNYAGENFFIDYNITGGDTVLVLIKGNAEVPNSMVKYLYTKVYSSPPENDYNINPTDYIINQKLFAGNYELKSQDNVMLNKDVVLENSGKINGFNDFHHYYVNCHYQIFPAGHQQMDYIMFYMPDSTIDMAYQKDKTALRLYTIEKDLKSGMRIRGQLAYTLIMKAQ